VVHAVLVAGAGPSGLTIVDLTHQVRAFDIRAGARTLARAAPYLGRGVVLAVVDPGVGTGRRALCLEVTPAGDGPRFFVGPDNGLLLEAAELVGGGTAAVRAFALPPHPTSDSQGITFDGRDLFAPTAAALCRGARPEEMGHPIDPLFLVRLRPDLVEYGRLGDGRHFLRAEVTWIDHFGNVQLAATAADAVAAELPPAPGGTIALAGAGAGMRRLTTFADAGPDELGLLVDSNGNLALIAGGASAAGLLSLEVGEMVVLAW
jgi:S-adenosyl-L-methionine hydrolase (adenosine-forming)